MNIATISEKFQICIPKKIRDQLDIEPGQQFIFIAKGNCLELVPKRTMKDLRGILKGSNIKKIRDRNERP